MRAGERARRPKPAKLAVNGELRGRVQGKAGEELVPEQVSAWLAVGFPDRPESAEPIPGRFNAIVARTSGRYASAKDGVRRNSAH